MKKSSVRQLRHHGPEGVLQWVQRTLPLWAGPHPVAMGGQSAGDADNASISLAAERGVVTGDYESSPLSGDTIRSIDWARGGFRDRRRPARPSLTRAAACLRELSTGRICRLKERECHGSYVTGAKLREPSCPSRRITAWTTGQFQQDAHHEAERSR